MKPEKIKEAELEELIAGEEYDVKGTTTICTLELKGRFRLIGSSACINPDDFSESLGRQMARQKAFDQLWQLEGYRRILNHALAPAEA